MHVSGEVADHLCALYGRCCPLKQWARLFIDKSMKPGGKLAFPGAATAATSTVTPTYSRKDNCP
jgi:hypothetical protein